MNQKGSDGPKFYVLSQEQIEDIMGKAVAAGTNAAMVKLDKDRKERKRKIRDRRLHNTKLLLRNYRMLKINAENSVFGRSQMEESAADILEGMMDLYNDEAIVQSIKNSASRTAIMVAHIEKMLEIYKTSCYKSGKEIDRRRYDVIEDYYIKERSLTVNVIAKNYNISRESVYNDINSAVITLSTFIFGVDCLYIR